MEEGKFLFIEVFQLINEEGMDRIRVSLFCDPSGVTDLSNDYQWLLITKRETTEHYVPLNENTKEQKNL